MSLDTVLSVTPSQGGGHVDTYRLQAENVQIIYDRSPLAAPIPGSNPFILDLGQYKNTIVIEGRISETGTNETEDGVAIADKDDLEFITSDWWDGTITFTVSGDSYTVKVRNTNFTLVAGLETVKWNYVLQMIGFNP